MISNHLQDHRRVFLHHLNPTFWPSWVSCVLWTLSIGVIAERTVQQRWFQRLLRETKRFWGHDRPPAFSFPPFGRLRSYLADWPLEQRLITLFSNTKRLLNRHASPLLWIRGTTVLVCGGILLTHSNRGMSLLNRAIETILFVPRSPWFFYGYYYESLCGWLCYGTLPWQLPVAVMTVLVIAVHSYRHVQRIARSPRRKKATRYLIHYVAVVAILLAVTSLVIVAPIFVIILVRACKTAFIAVTAVPSFPELVFQRFYTDPLHVLFCYGIVSWKLFAAVAVIVTIAFTILRTGHALADSAHRDKVTRLMLSAFAVLTGLILMVLVVRNIGLLGLFLIIAVSALMSLPSYFAAEFYFLPLQALFSYGVVSWHPLAFVAVVTMVAWGIYSGAIRLARSQYAPNVTNSMVRSACLVLSAGGLVVAVWVGLILLQPIFHHFCRLGPVHSLYVFQRVFILDLFCDLFCYGKFSRTFFLVLAGLVTTVYGINRMGRFLARFKGRVQATCTLIGILSVAASLVAAEWNAFLNALNVTWNVFCYEKERLYDLPLYALFCYGRTPWTLIVIIGLTAVPIAAIHRTAQAVSTSVYRERTEQCLRWMLIVGASVLTIGTICHYRLPLMETPLVAVPLFDRITTDFYRQPLHNFFCYGMVSWRILLALGFLTLLVCGIHQGGKLVSRSRHSRILSGALAGALVPFGVVTAVFVADLRGPSFLLSPKHLMSEFCYLPFCALFSYGMVSWKLLVVFAVMGTFAYSIFAVARSTASGKERGLLKKTALALFGMATVAMIVFAHINVLEPVFGFVWPSLTTVYATIWEQPFQEYIVTGTIVWSLPIILSAKCLLLFFLNQLWKNASKTGQSGPPDPLCPCVSTHPTGIEP